MCDGACLHVGCAKIQELFGERALLLKGHAFKPEEVDESLLTLAYKAEWVYCGQRKESGGSRGEQQVEAAGDSPYD